MGISMGVLAGDDETETLSDDEYTLLKSCLALARREGDREAAAIAYALRQNEGCERQGTFGELLSDALQIFGDHTEAMKGLFLRAGDRPILLHEDNQGEERIECVEALLKLLKRNDWLATYLSAVLVVWSSKPSPTPHRVINSLIEDAHGFESDIRNAKDLLAQYPSLFEDCNPLKEEVH